MISQTTTGTIVGTVTDNITNETLPFVKIVLSQGDSIQVNYVSTDFTGKYKISSIPPGSYNLKIQFIGYTSQSHENIIISNHQLLQFDIALSSSNESLDCVEIKYSATLMISNKN